MSRVASLNNSVAVEINYNMAQIEDDKTNQWLNENELDSIIDTCNKHKITLEVLMVADVDDLRSLCKEAQMPTTIMLKLKNALMKTADSVLGTQKQIIVVSSEEKTLKDKFDQVFKKLRIMLQQNQQCQSTLESKKNNAINNINSSMDEIIEIIELKRRNLIDEINVMSEEHSKKLNQQKINGNKLKQLFMEKANELNDIQNGNNISFKDVFTVCIEKYYQFMQQFGAISSIFDPIININKIDAVIKKSCYLKENDSEIPHSYEHKYDYEICKFSEKYRSDNGLLSLNNDKTVLTKPYKKSQEYSFIALDEEPLSNGIHCYRIKVVGRNSFAYFGIHNDIKNASISYDDKNSCGTNIFSWHKSDTNSDVIYDKIFEDAKEQSELTWDMLIILSDDGMVLKFNLVGTDKEISIPILTKNKSWTPHFIFYAGGHRRTKYRDTKVEVFKMDNELFGKEIDEFQE
eukprot:552138_1